jgi:hypothetical protein
LWAGKRKIQIRINQKRQNDMKKMTTTAILVGGAILAAQSAWAQSVVPNNLYMGFQNNAGGASADYIINLGAASGIIGGTSVVDLSGDFSQSDFDSVLNASANLMGGVVGGNQNGSSSDPYDNFVTQLRVGGAGNAATPGSDLSGFTLSSANDSTAFSDLGSLDAPAAGTGVLDTGKSWQNAVENGTEVSGTFWSATGVNPDSAVGDSDVLYEDLWQSSSPGGFSSYPYQYLGYFTLNTGGGSPSLTFTPQAVPEPSVLGLLSGAGLLLLAFRRRLNVQNA